jgi:thymidine kinase
MAKLYFYYSAMNAGKSTILLQSAYNYTERGMDTLLYAPSIDTRFGTGRISSRIGLTASAISFDQSFDLFNHTRLEKDKNPKISCVLIDEAQFLTKEQVHEATKIVDILDIPVLAYGIRSDFQGEPFVGSLYLLIWADNLIELKTICFCGKKAIMNARMDAEGRFVKQGSQVLIGDNDTYTAMCRKHFWEV